MAIKNICPNESDENSRYDCDPMDKAFRRKKLDSRGGEETQNNDGYRMSNSGYET